MQSFPTFFIGNPSRVFSQKPLVSETRRTWLPDCGVHENFCVAGFRPGGRGPFVSAKGPKTIDAQFGLIGGTDAGWGADQLATLKQGPPVDKSV